jgi:urease accessory protein
MDRSPVLGLNFGCWAITESQAGEGRIKIRIGIADNGFGPDDIQQPFSSLGDVKYGAARTIGFHDGHRLAVKFKTGQLDRGPRKPVTLKQDMNWQLPRFAQCIRIPVGHDFQFEARDHGRTAISTTITRSDANKGFGPAAVDLPTGRVGCAGARAEVKRSGETLSFGIVVEPDRGQFGGGISCLHRDHIEASLGEDGGKIGRAASRRNFFAQVRPSRWAICGQNQYPIGISRPALPGAAMPHSYSCGNSNAGTILKRTGLQPEIMCNSCGREEAKRSEAKREFHFMLYTTGVNPVHNNKPSFAEAKKHSFALSKLLSNSIFGKSRVFVAIFTFTAFLIAGTTPALAHSGTGLAGGFVSGFLHPLSGPDHLLAMVSVGIWGVFLGRPLLVVLPMLFPTMMTFGAGLGMLHLPVPPVEIGIALSVIVLGMLILMAARLAVLPACAVVAIFALFHGYAHGAELPSAADPVGYSVGFVFATGLLHLCGIALGMLTSLPYGKTALRGSGGLIALVGSYFMAGALMS